MQATTVYQDSIIVGSLLGDGFLTKPKYGNSSFVKNQCGKRDDYLKWHFDALMPFSSRLKKSINICNNKNYDRIHFSTKSNSIFTELRHKWYPDGVKIVPHDLVFDDLMLAIWFADDGSSNHKKRACTLATYGFSRKECEFLRKKFIEYGIPCGIISTYNVLFFSGEGYDNIINKISPHVSLWPSFHYKIAHRPSSRIFMKKSQIENIIKYKKDGLNYYEIQEKTNCSYGAIQQLLTGHTHKELGIKKPQNSTNNTSGHSNIFWDNGRNCWRFSFRRKTKSCIRRFKSFEEAIAFKNSFLKT